MVWKDKLGSPTDPSNQSSVRANNQQRVWYLQLRRGIYQHRNRIFHGRIIPHLTAQVLR